MVRSRNSCSKTKRSFSSITLLVFHGMRLFYTQLPKFPQCQGCSRSILSGMCPVRTSSGAYPPPMFLVSVASKELRVCVSGLESTLTGISTSVDSKEVAGGEKDNSRTANFDGVRRRRDRPVSNQIYCIWESRRFT